MLSRLRQTFFQHRIKWMLPSFVSSWSWWYRGRPPPSRIMSDRTSRTSAASPRGDTSARTWRLGTASSSHPQSRTNWGLATIVPADIQELQRQHIPEATHWNQRIVVRLNPMVDCIKVIQIWHPVIKFLYVLGLSLSLNMASIKRLDLVSRHLWKSKRAYFTKTRYNRCMWITFSLVFRILTEKKGHKFSPEYLSKEFMLAFCKLARISGFFLR